MGRCDTLSEQKFTYSLLSPRARAPHAGLYLMRLICSTGKAEAHPDDLCSQSSHRPTIVSFLHFFLITTDIYLHANGTLGQIPQSTQESLCSYVYLKCIPHTVEYPLSQGIT